MVSRATRAMALLATAAALACGGGSGGDGGAGQGSGDAGAGAAAASAGSGAGPATAGAPGDPGARAKCSYTGRWDPCTVAERLDRSGLAPQPATGTPAHASLGAPAAAWTVGGAPLTVWIYPDRGARERAEKGLDMQRYLRPDEDVEMNPLPTVISSENLLAILDSRNEHQRERVADAITAGPPQAAP